MFLSLSSGTIPRLVGLLEVSSKRVSMLSKPLTPLKKYSQGVQTCSPGASTINRVAAVILLAHVIDTRHPPMRLGWVESDVQDCHIVANSLSGSNMLSQAINMPGVLSHNVGGLEVIPEPVPLSSTPLALPQK